MGCWAGPKAGMNVLKKRKISRPCLVVLLVARSLQRLRDQDSRHSFTVRRNNNVSWLVFMAGRDCFSLPHGFANSDLSRTRTRVGPKVSSLTNKSRAKWKMLRAIYSAIYSEVNVSVWVCVEIKGDYIEKQQSCFIYVTLKSWSGWKLLDSPSLSVFVCSN